MACLAVVHAAQLVCVSGGVGLGIVADGAMVVREGRIEWVGPTDEMPAFEGETIDASGKVVLPGFVDAHTHVVFGGSRASEFEMRSRGATYEEIATAGGGIRSTVASTRLCTEDELVLAATKRMRWMSAGGTTTIEAKSGYGLSLASELKLLRAIRRLPEAIASNRGGGSELPKRTTC